MRLWRVDFPGHWFGGEAVMVGPDSMVAAKDIVMERLQAHGLGEVRRRDVKMREHKYCDLKEGQFLHFWDGDY
jgi:hypothetical protein